MGTSNESWAISCPVRDESAYLDTWLSHHVALGASRIYVYDNNVNASEIDRTKAIIQAYPGVAVHISWHMYDNTYELPWVPVRVGKNSFLASFAAKYGLGRLQFAHADAINRAKAEGIPWLQKLDADEFLMPFKNVTASRYYAAQGCGVRVPRFDFGSSGHVSKPDANVLESYTMRECAPSNYKEAGRTSAIYGSPSSHRWSYAASCMRSARGNPSDMAIFHYITKSQQEYIKRKATDARYLHGNSVSKLKKLFAQEQKRTNCTRDLRAQRQRQQPPVQAPLSTCLITIPALARRAKC